MGLADFIKNKLQLAPNWITLPLLHLNHLGDRIYGSRMREFKRSIPEIDPERKLVDMANYAITHVPYYRNRYKGKIISSIADFQATFGFIDKTEVMAHFDEFVSDEIDKIPHVLLSTSGTSGKPLRLMMNADRYVTEMAFNTRMLERDGWDYGVRASIRKKQLPKGKDFVVNPATKELIFDGYRTDKEYLANMLRVMRKNGCVTLYGFPSNITQVLHRMREFGLDTSFIRRAILTSEAVTMDHYRFIEDEMGIKIITFYGHTEKLILIEQVDRQLFTIEPGYGFTEIIGEDGSAVAHPGDEGELVGSTFYNRAMPLLRYRTGDYATYTGETAKIDGCEKPTVGRISGRREKSIIYRHDGSYTTSNAFEIHDERQMSFEAIQYLQERRGYLVALVVKGPNYNPEDEGFMRKHYGYAMLGEQYVEIRYVDSLITQPNGKTLTVINLTI